METWKGFVVNNDFYLKKQRKQSFSTEHCKIMTRLQKKKVLGSPIDINKN